MIGGGYLLGLLLIFQLCFCSWPEWYASQDDAVNAFLFQELILTLTQHLRPRTALVVDVLVPAASHAVDASRAATCFCAAGRVVWDLKSVPVNQAVMIRQSSTSQANLRIRKDK